MASAKCTCCESEIAISEGGMTDRVARIERGDFSVDDHSEDNIKFSVLVCHRCFMEDEDLCRFFNKLGLRAR